MEGRGRHADPGGCGRRPVSRELVSADSRGEEGRQPLLELNRPLELFRLLRSGLQVFGGVREGSSGIFTFIVAQYVLSFG